MPPSLVSQPHSSFKSVSKFQSHLCKMENIPMEPIENGKPVLYSYFRSSCSWRVRIALALKKIDYIYKAVHLDDDWGEQFSEEFAKLNPSQEVPVFVDKGNVLRHSVPIIEYLEETRPEFPLLPSNPVDRSRVRGLVESIVSNIQPLQNDRVLARVGEDSQEWAKYWIERGFAALEVFNAHRFDVDMTNYPLISHISSLLANHEDFQSSHPFKQPDCPKELAIVPQI